MAKREETEGEQVEVLFSEISDARVKGALERMYASLNVHEMTLALLPNRDYPKRSGIGRGDEMGSPSLPQINTISVPITVADVLLAFIPLIIIPALCKY